MRILFVVMTSCCAFACPVCDSRSGRAVRNALFNDQFGFHLFATILPFVFFLAAAAIVYFGLTRRGAWERM